MVRLEKFGCIQCATLLFSWKRCAYAFEMWKKKSFAFWSQEIGWLVDHDLTNRENGAQEVKMSTQSIYISDLYIIFATRIMVVSEITRCDL